MLPDPTERNINPLLFQTGIRTVKKLVLTLAPFHLKSAVDPKLTDTMSFEHPAPPPSPKQRLITAVPTT